MTSEEKTPANAPRSRGSGRLAHPSRPDGAVHELLVVFNDSPHPDSSAKAAMALDPARPAGPFRSVDLAVKAAVVANSAVSPTGVLMQQASRRSFRRQPSDCWGTYWAQQDEGPATNFDPRNSPDNEMMAGNIGGDGVYIESVCSSELVRSTNFPARGIKDAKFVFHIPC